jgi:signal peptidase I
VSPRVAAMLGAVLALGLLVRSRWTVATVRGGSMAPTLADGQRLLVRRVPRAPRRGEVVVFATRPVAGLARPGDDPPYRVKRVCAVAGDPAPDWVAGRHDPLVPPGFLVVSGDNPRSQDSRQLGLIDRRAVLGVLSPRRTGGAPAPRRRTVRPRR